jgi:hypothetical protein
VRREWMGTSSRDRKRSRQEDLERSQDAECELSRSNGIVRSKLCDLPLFIWVLSALGFGAFEK